MRVRAILGYIFAMGAVGLACDNGMVSLGSGPDGGGPGGGNGSSGAGGSGGGGSSSGVSGSSGGPGSGDDGGVNGSDGGQGGSGDACTLALAVCPTEAPANQQSCALGCGQSPLQCHYDCAHGHGYVTNATCDGQKWSVAALLIACSITPDGGTAGGDGSTAGCATNADCPNGDVCGFPTAPACSATGSCFTPPGAVCNLFMPGCGCDGSELNLANCATGLPAGYAPKPVLHSGVCADAAGGTDDGGDAGDCCPTGWFLYSCTFPDGGAGMACHNPQLGCPSSGTCGTGCDSVATGRCGG